MSADLNAHVETAADVQEELQQYINSTNINALFIQIVERLLIEKPDNPIGFIVEWLQKTYPDQTAAPARHVVPNLSQTMSASEDEDDVDPAANEIDDIELKDKSSAGRIKRRASVSAESLDPHKAKGEVRKVAKNTEESKRILGILQHNKFLCHLDDNNMNSLVEAFTSVEKKAGDVIIQQGDPGDNFYVIESGKVEVFKNKPDGSEAKVHECGPGEVFGELAIMYNAPRAATCKAADDVKLWALDRMSFKLIIMQAAIGKRAQYSEFLKQVEILKQLEEYELLTLSDCLKEESYKEGAIIFEQGQPGDVFYIVKEGSVLCYQKDATGKDVQVACLTTGNYFGEIALLTAKARQATVKAGSDLKLLSIDRGTFKRVLGPIEDILQRNMAAYNKVQATAI